MRRPQLNPIWLPRILDTPERDLRKLVQGAGREIRFAHNPEKGDAVSLFVEREANATSIEAALARAYEAPERSTAEAKQVAAAEAPVLAQNAAAATKHYKLGRIVFAVSFPDSGGSRDRRRSPWNGSTIRPRSTTSPASFLRWSSDTSEASPPRDVGRHPQELDPSPHARVP